MQKLAVEGCVAINRLNIITLYTGLKSEAVIKTQSIPFLGYKSYELKTKLLTALIKRNTHAFHARHTHKHTQVPPLAPII